MTVARSVAHRRWHVKVNEAASHGPPYPVDMPVTPKSNFGADFWEEPAENLPAGGKNRRIYDFFGPSQIARFGFRSLKRSDATLITQFKDAMIGVKHHRYALHPDMQRIGIPKPRTWYKNHLNFRRIFVAASLMKISNIGHFTQHDLDELMKLLAVKGTGRREVSIHIDYLLRLSKHGLLTNVTEMHPLELVFEPKVWDTTRARGAQPLTDEQIQVTLEASIIYIDNVKEIARSIEWLRKGICTEAQVKAWAKQRLPCKVDIGGSMVTALLLLVQVSAANLIGHHLGTRPSETLSMKAGCVTTAHDETALDVSRMTIAMQTFKAIRQIGGDTRYLSVSAYIKTAIDAVELVMSSAGAVSDYLFSHPAKDEEFNDNEWNRRFSRFCHLHRFNFNYTATSWRKSLISIMMSAFDNPIAEVAALAYHKSEHTTAGYAQSSPFVMNEYNEGYTRILRGRYHTLFESTAALGGPGIGGPQGIEIEKRLPELFPTDLTELDLKMTIDEYIDDLLEQGVTPMLVRPGVLCVKGANSPGYCSRATGDTIPDPSRCSSLCQYQVQLPEAKEMLQWELEHLTDKIESRKLSLLQRDFWVRDILDRVSAWPGLRPLLDEALNANETLKLWFAEK
ncbi:hypothetical protein [Neorhizobium tomejilense]|uniref:hypothetical protein n=1 Tax=Neorhizobium tomejilense TaxID=2093828 RepID=UPI000CF946A7|nr:hypothetical protein [Neorhizobium tomejilense]